MLPSRREFHPTVYAAGIMSRFPAWMKLQQPSSIGFRFVDTILGNELELFSNTLDIYKTYNSIVQCPIDALTKLYQVELPHFLNSVTIESEEGTIINIVENDHEFLTNPPTRITGPEIIQPSGLEGASIVGLEWLDGFPTGSLVIKRDSSDITASSLLYYDISTKNDLVNLQPVSGISFGIAYVGLGQNSSFNNINQPESEWSLKKKYPDGIWITPSGEQTTKPSGIFDTQSFIDSDTGVKTYYKKSLNNPYGSGIYNQADTTLTFTPISGTIKVYDVFNLTSGVPTEIPSSGLNYYTFTSGYYNSEIDTTTLDTWNYKGFDNPIPWDILPQDMKNDRVTMGFPGVGPIPTLAGNVSWRMLPIGGYVDDEVYPNNGTFNWIDGPSTSGSNTIRFSGHFSKYDIQYAYQQYDNITQISADPKDAYKSASPSGGQLFFITGTEFYQSLRFETSTSNSNAIRIEPYILRPGTIVYYTLTTNTKRQDVWKNARTVDKTVQFYRHNIGATDNLGYRND